MLKAILALLAIATAGCAEMSYKDYPDGRTEFSRSAWWSDVTITGLTASTDKNGTRHIDLRGYQNDQSESLEAISRGVAEGMVKGAKGGM